MSTDLSLVTIFVGCVVLTVCNDLLCASEIHPTSRPLLFAGAIPSSSQRRCPSPWYHTERRYGKLAPPSRRERFQNVFQNVFQNGANPPRGRNGGRTVGFSGARNTKVGRPAVVQKWHTAHGAASSSAEENAVSCGWVGLPPGSYPTPTSTVDVHISTLA